MHSINKILFNPVFFVTLLLLVHLLLSVATIGKLSQTYDEASTLLTGYSYLKAGDLKGGVSPHFPSIWAALPLLLVKPALPAQHPSWNDANERMYNRFYFADQFLYNNKADPEVILNSARYAMIAFSLLLGFALYSWAKAKYGLYAGFIALVLWCFSSNFIAFGTLVTSDLPFTLFYFLSVYFFWKWSGSDERRDNLYIILTGLSVGFACVTKYSAILVFPLIALIYLWVLYGSKNKKSVTLKQLGLCAAAVVIVIAATYRFIDLKYFIDGLRLTYSNVGLQKKTVFLWGRLSSDGWFYYFLAAFLLKTPIPFFVMLLAGMRLRKTAVSESAAFILFPAFFFLLASCFVASNSQIGVRYILPAYPFFMLWAAGSLARFKTYAGRIAGILLLLWYVAEALMIHPWHISYFNEFIGSQNNASKYLTDSNLDWGQGLKELGKYVNQRGPRTIYLSYFGNGDPHYYGINYVGVHDWNDLNYSRFTEKSRLGKDTGFYIKEGQPVLYAISAMHRSYTIDQDWLKGIPYETIVAHSIFVYDLSKYPQGLAKLEQIVKAQEPSSFTRGYECQKKGEIDNAINYYNRDLKENGPDRMQTWFNLGYAYIDKKEFPRAVECFKKVLQLKPDYYEATVRLAECSDKVKPPQKYDFFALAFAYQKMGDLDNSIANYIKYLDVYPGSSQAWFNLGYAYMDKKEYRRAIDCFKITLKLKPDYEEAVEHILYCSTQLSKT